MDDRKQIRIFMVIIGILGFIMLFAAIYLLPQLIDFSISTYPEIAYLARPVGIIVVVSAIPFFVVLIQTFMLSKYILTDVIYTDKPLKALNIISIASIIICLLFFIEINAFMIDCNSNGFFGIRTNTPSKYPSSSITLLFFNSSIPPTEMELVTIPNTN